MSLRLEILDNGILLWFVVSCKDFFKFVTRMFDDYLVVLLFITIFASKISKLWI